MALNCDFEMAREEMHVLAYVYRWDRNTIWKLTRKERKFWVEQVLKQKEAENKAMNKSTSLSSKVPSRSSRNY